MAIRQAALADSDAIFDLERYAYDYPADHVQHAKTIFEKTFDEYHVLEDTGRVLGTGRLICFDQNMRGSWGKMGGLGSLATSPEIRRQGHARALMNYVIELMHNEGYATSMLYPFKDTFYAAFGYINCPPVLSVVVNPKQLRRCKKPHGYSFQRLSVSKGIDFFKYVHDKSADSHHGAVRRGDRRWEEMTAGNNYEIVIVFGSDGGPEGLMLYQNRGYSKFGDNKAVGTMTVKEWYFLSCEARTAMLNYIYLHADQIINVSIPINPMTDDYYHWVQDRNIPSIRARRSYMARVIDVVRAIDGIPTQIRGELCVQIEDPHFDWNNQTFRIYQEKGTLHAERISEVECDTVISIEGITALVYGTAHIDTLACFGWIHGKVPSVLSEWFSKRDIWMTEDF